MNIFKKLFTDTITEAKETENLINEVSAPTPTLEPEPKEAWVWVEGYKGTDKDMKCRGYQYELGVQHDMPADEPIEECKSGFHLCLSLEDVYSYYNIGDNHRFFRVKALVRVSDVKKYGEADYVTFNNQKYYIGGSSNNKLTSKSIIFLSELTSDEILQGTEIYNLPSQYHSMAISHNIKFALTAHQKDTLIEDGYSETFATHIISVGKFDIAHAVGSQKDLSMDVKVLAILYDKSGG